MHVWQKCVIGCLAALVPAPAALAGPSPAATSTSVVAKSAPFLLAGHTLVTTTTMTQAAAVAPRMVCCDPGGTPAAGCGQNPFVLRSNVHDAETGIVYAWRQVAIDSECWDGSGHITTHATPRYNQWTGTLGVTGWCWQNTSQGASYSADRMTYYAWNDASLSNDGPFGLGCGWSGTRPVHVQLNIWPGGYWSGQWDA